MSMPTTGTTFGKLKLDNIDYNIFNLPISEDIIVKIQDYKKEHKLGYTSAPWIANKYEWFIEDNKLYLKYMHFFNDPQDNAMDSIFGISPLFAEWVDEEIKILISKKDILEADNTITENEINAVNKQGRILVDREVKILSFSKGILKSVSPTLTERYTQRQLKYYIER